MNQKFRLPLPIFLLFFLAFFIVACNPKEPTPPSSDGVIATPVNYLVRVVDSDTVEAISNASVKIVKSNSEPPETVFTDNQGIAVFNNIDPGNIDQLSQLIVKAQGYDNYSLFIQPETNKLPSEIRLTSVAAPISTRCPDAPTILSSTNNLTSGEMLELIVNANGRDLEYAWKADRGEFNVTDAAIVEFIAPIGCRSPM